MCCRVSKKIGFHCDCFTNGKTLTAIGFAHTVTKTGSLMTQRHTSINDLAIKANERKFQWPTGRRPDDHPGLTQLGL
jgi:uncharacterized protein